MPIGVTDEHEALRQSAAALLERHCGPGVVRAALDSTDEALPPFWSVVAEAGWFGLHVPEEYGGSGFGLPELVVVAEQLGRSAAPGPAVPTVLAAAFLAQSGGAAAKELLPGVVDGSTPAAVAFGAGPVEAEEVDGSLRLSGVAAPVVGGALARLVLLPVSAGAGVTWCAVDVDAARVRSQGSLDLTRRLVELDVSGVLVPPERRLELSADDADALTVVVLGAEMCGLAAWCLDTATAYAKTRVQFGRPIGTFQAVKHRCADLLVAVEQARAVVWDAARAGVSGEGARLAAAAAGAIALEVGVQAAKDCIQLLGGIGFTWEHDAHVYLRRALALRQLLGPASAYRARAAELAVAGVRRPLDVELPAEAERYRERARAFTRSLEGLDEAGVRRRLVDDGYLAPHWPEPWGRGADSVEQLVIDEEFRRAGVRRPGLAIAAWVVPTLIEHGSPAQQERWIRPTLDGEVTWCQLFSEPGAGSDLAALRTRAERVEGGWLVTGQKVWTSMARQSSHAILLARTAPPAADNRRAGITYFLVDMKTAGIDVRPLTELTGQALFNEVFLDGVFVPDDCVVGEVGDGWRLARTTLANERVQMGSGSSFGTGVDTLLKGLDDDLDPLVKDRIGGLVVEAQSLALLGFRSTLRAISGAAPGPEASLRKLLGAEHEQRVQELGLELLGRAGATTEGAAAGWSYGFLVTRCLTIAGGTSEVQRNVIGERLLGLPRDAD
jgi:alkylation response protein AidB-like acyl-CoA dehydrogenase